MILVTISLCVGIFGSAFGIISFFWNRRTSGLDVLTGVLEPMVRSAQHLMRANTSRRQCERIKASFPDLAAAPEAAQQARALIDEYSRHIRASEEEYSSSEASFGARSFRFPDSICRKVRNALGSLSELGRLVNEGFFEKADLQVAKWRDDYAEVVRAGRAWRPIDPLEGMRRRVVRQATKPETENEFELSAKELDAIMELVHKRATSQARNTFAVHPPKKLLENPSIAQSERVIEELKDSVFLVAFQDGTSTMMSLPELMYFVYNLILVASEYEKLSRMVQAMEPKHDMDIKVSFEIVIRDLMRKETVKALLQKIEFSDTSSDG